jgi:hypothetical protein
MPFSTSTGVYTPATGATTAAPGQLIQSAIWNGIFTDISTALTLLGRQLYGSTPVGASSYNVLATDTLLLVDFAGAVTIDLLAASSAAGYPITIKDTSGAAHTNNITITPNGADTIEGLTTVPINSDYGYYRLYPVSGGWVIIP